MSVLIKTNDLEKKFGEIRAVDGITLQVEKGEVLGFLGPNGAGKSTTMKMITGFLTPDSGTAEICGFDIVEQTINAKKLIGYLPEGAPLYGEMTPKSFLKFIAEIHGLRGSEVKSSLDLVIEKTGLQSVLNQTIETLSKGFKRRVGLAQAIIHDPEVLILDEPTDGLDPNQKHHVRKLIQEMSSDKAIIISTHILEEVEAVCSRAIVINKGKIIADGTAEELQRRVPYHNSVIIHTRAESADIVRKRISTLKHIAEIETLGEVNGSIKLRAVPLDGSSIVPNVAAVLRESEIPVDEIFVEQGRLDDVFRQLTTSENGDQNA